MAERHDTMMNPHIEGLLDRTSSKFRLVTLASQRARQINAYFGHLGDGLGTAVPPQVLRMRFGIDMNTDHTLEEVGKQFDVTRERIRQIEAKALRKLRHPTRSEHLRSFLDE